MIRRETYEWMEPILEEAEREGARVISVSHHNLLDESGVSRTFMTTVRSSTTRNWCGCCRIMACACT